LTKIPKPNKFGSSRRISVLTDIGRNTAYKEYDAMTDDVRGSVLVLGGGIAGMQASLDLANSGYYVHLVEKSSAIGGLMSQLDKTFPTNDCAM
jgi:heterodisulfide reductase subunit A